MTHTCKICGTEGNPRHTILGIVYYHCPQCHFLYNSYWETRPSAESEQQVVNDVARADRWPAGKEKDMRNKGWEMLELMESPIAWNARRAHTFLKKFSWYRNYLRNRIKTKYDTLLDFGCGHGITVLELQNKDNFRIVGLDPFSPTKHESIITEDLLAHKFPDEHFAGIFSIETLEHIPNVLEVFSELHRILKPGGTLLVQTHRLEEKAYSEKKDKWFYIQDPKTHVSIYSEPAMKKIAQKTGFSNVSFKGVKFAKFVK